LMEKWIQEKDNIKDYLGILGDKVLKKGSIEYALEIYIQNFNNDSSYLNYCRLINLFEKTKETALSEKLIKDMYKKYPNSLWCESKLEELG
ncbi:hypothetical protein V7127_25500, partial [Bacillus sp. JJ1773]|uniref:hypothetical protein n=1 Tax=Bacillus sp. JJ1773 TaxID=3122965 RepID=UPI002FFF20B5